MTCSAEKLKQIIDEILAEWPDAPVIRFTAQELIMVDPTEDQIAAILACSDPAGEYLDSLGKTDLATLSEDEWYTFLEVVVTGYQDKLMILKKRKYEDENVGGL